jgi:hypothetical protein
MKKLLFWLAGFLPCRIISDNGEAYLERYYVCTLFGVRVYLHRFVGNDPARGLHCHPWPWAGSVVLSGWYYELTRSGLNRVRWLNWLTGDTFHQVILPFGESSEKRQCWTLFFHRAKYVKPWGFLNAENPLGFKPPSVYVWKAWDHDKGGDGTATSSDWWHTAPQGRFCKQRQPR